MNANQFQVDLESESLPDFSLYIPNNHNNGHDTGVEFADRWLSRFFEPIFQEPKVRKDTVYVVTFDEVGTGTTKEEFRVATLFFGDKIRSGAISNQDYDHFCLLRTIEDIFRLPSLGKRDAKADPIDDIWK